CRNTTLLFARGTSETTNMGGLALAAALRTRLGSSAVAQGISYPADMLGAITGALDPKNADGSVDCDNKIGTLLLYCPSTRIVISGYSRANSLKVCYIHLTIQPSAIEHNCRATVTFGDPLSKTSFDKISSRRAQVFCNAGDPVCNGQFIITPAYLTYDTVAITPAVDFIA
ncbi:cutinase, partial [Auriculariales sp. MPI-PUGE-AT-0066]